MKIVNEFSFNEKTKRIEVFDSRWYEIKETGEHFPSATTILSAKGKGYALEKWLKQVGMNADIISKNAMDEGSNVHFACERLLMGEEVSYYDQEGKENFKFYEEWRPICAFSDFYKTYNPEPILIEQTVYDLEEKYAGTIDLLCKLTDPKTGKKEISLIDLKRAQSSNMSYEYQLASYYFALHKMNWLMDDMGISKIDSVYILLLNVETKKRWRLHKIENLEAKMDCFLAIKKIWEAENNLSYIQETYPTKIKLTGGEQAV